MAKYTSGEFQEHHQGDREYCRESGPVNYKAISFPPLLLRNGLGLASSAAVILTLILILLPVSLTSRALSLGITDAVIRVEIQNRPTDRPLRYILTPAENPNVTTAEGNLDGDVQTLRFEGLTPDTEYLISYFIEESDDWRKLGDLRFRTLAEPTEPTEPSTEPTLPPAESTEPPTEPTEPPTEPAEPPTEPTEPPTRPTVPPTEPTEPPTEPTEPPTEPTEPPTEPTEPPTEPTEPPTEPTEPPTEPTEPPTEPTEPPTEDSSEITFTNIAPSGYGYSYTVNARFANLTGCTPLSAALFREEYSWYWNESNGEVPVAEFTDLAIDEEGVLLVTWDTPEEDAVPREQNGHRWRAVLTYLDADGAEQTLELIDSIEPLSSHFNNFSGTLWKSGNTYYLDYIFHTFINPNLNPGEVEFDTAHVLGWNLESAVASRDGDLLTVTGLLSTDSISYTGLNTYWIWTEIGSENTIYSGCGGGEIVPFTSRILSATPNADGSGYTDVTEEHTFQGGASTTQLASIRIRVTLANGTVITLTQGESDPTGQVSIHWDDGGNIVVTVTQVQVATGGSCTVERIISYLWEDSGDRNITATDISRSSMYYSDDPG